MTSVVDTSVKFAVSSMQDAPVISGTAGSLIAALDAFLVNGFANKQVTSGAVSGGVCRLNFTGQSAAMVHSVILVAGITGANAALNGEQRVTTVSSSWIEFKTDLPDGVIAGSISFKLAPLGWEKVFTGTNKAVYRASDLRGTRMFYRVDDSNALYARVQMFEAMSDVDTGIAAAPSLVGGYYIAKRDSASATGSYWLMIGDSRGFYLSVALGSSAVTPTAPQYGAVTRYFGDLVSNKSGDAWCGFLSGGLSSGWNSTDGCMFRANSAGAYSFARAVHGLGGAYAPTRVTFGSGVSGLDTTLGVFPAIADNGLHLSKIVMREGDLGPRGVIPGAYHCLQNSVAGAYPLEVKIAPGAAEFKDKMLLSIGVGTPGTGTNGIGFFDATGPWRM